MIHWFNPGHETAVLNASPFYQAPENQVKMQQDLAFLPAWYAGKNDFVFIEHPLPDSFQQQIQAFSIAEPITTSEIHPNSERLKRQIVSPWGISPQSIHYFEKLNRQYSVDWQIPVWTDDLRHLGSRFTAQEILFHLIASIPSIENNILPQFFSSIEEIETYLSQSTDKQLLKSPFSSSGRGLIWLPPGKLARSERQIISGMLKKQGQVSIEKALDKRLDFSMHFDIPNPEEIHFLSYSVFQTNAKGAYERSRLASQTVLLQEITNYISIETLEAVKQQLLVQIKNTYAVHYQGTIGVDMLIYFSGNRYRLHPCVEINMRKSMGYLALQFSENILAPDSEGVFFVEFYTQMGNILDKNRELQTKYPLVVREGRVVSGYLALCPVNKDTRYWSYVVVGSYTGG
ncbi:hypothetical protein FACS189413_04600 [Bacteroidia bacterium]|nr:hypothetical protein FACS189413_04600 [Bacteroidia bacterium]